jgi:hypothetical protein
MRSSRHDNPAGDIPDPAWEALGITERPAIIGETLDPDPVQRIDLFADLYT